MNKERRKRIGDVADEVDMIIEMVEEIKDEEQEAYDNMPESLQVSMRGQASEEAIGMLEDVICSLQEASEQLGDLRAI